jgi:hypothetical protein
MCTSQAPEHLDGFCSYSVFKSLSFIGQCLVSLNFPALKLKALQMIRKTQNADFFLK